MAESEAILLRPYTARKSSVDTADSEAQISTSPIKNDTRIFTRLFKTKLPEFERSLRDQAENPDKSNAENIEKRESFAHAYRDFAKQPLRELLESIVWYYRFPSPKRGQQAESFPEDLLQHKDYRSASGLFRRPQLGFKDKKTGKEGKKATFGSLLEDLSNKIASAQRDCFELCVITAEVPLSHQAFRFSQKLRASISGGLTEFYEAPKLAVLYVIKMHWQFDHDVLQQILKPEPLRPRINEKTVLPSKIRPRASIDTFQKSDSPKSRMTLQWYSECERYIGDLDTYVWQTYGRPPKPDYLRLYIETREDSNIHRAIIVFKTKKLSADFLSLLSSSVSDTSCLMMTKGRQPVLDLIDTVVALFKLVANGNETFIQGLRAQLEELKYEGRKSPSGSKVQFLLHLNDCRVDALRCLKECLVLLSDTGKSLTAYTILEDDLKSRICEEFEVCEKDFAALITILEDADSAIEKTRIMIDQQLNLAQVRRQSVLAVLAALYLPLAYVSGLFGMNITNTSLGLDTKYTNITNLTNNATLDFTKLSPSQVDDILAVVGNSGGHAWDFKWYWITLVPLLFGSIVLPILAGPIIRVIFQNIARYRLYWRIGGIVLAIFYVIGIYGVLWNFIVGITWSRVNGVYPEYHDGEYYEDYTGVSYAVANIIYFVTTAGAYCFAVLYQLFRAFKHKNNRVLWVFFLLILAGLVFLRVITFNAVYAIDIGSYRGPTSDSMFAASHMNRTTIEYWLIEGFTLDEAAFHANDTASMFNGYTKRYNGPIVSLDYFNLLPWIVLWLGWAWPGIKRWVARKSKAMVKKD